jgi:tetratricopeptide (TPR) repeat protein
MPADPKRVKDLFMVVSESPAEDRAAVLHRECGGDDDLRQRVEALLAAHDAPGQFLNPPAVHGTGAYRPAHGLKVGEVFAGRFKLKEELGEGGMGVVFVADQIEPVQRRVALKIIKTGADSDRMLARFEQERQALALMDHPNIAKVLDAGVADSGQPYFVMELIKGVPLTQYCDEARLTPRQRLELFVPVCQAVQHAHQKGIIHRDLKPSNILIGLYDGRPVPKVIDFGVAKATGPRISEHSVYTEVGTVIGTYEYMSPEQAELNNLDIDTRSDIYALGVILYELLTGTVPFTRKELQSSGFAEMLRIIKEKEPPKPSTRLSASRELPSVAAVRQTEAAKLSRLIRGDLDWITMKALEKDRSRRYETANGLAMDVQRHLADEPVAAGPPSAGYRVRKFAQRNRAAVATAAAVVAALLLGTAVATWQAVRARRAELEARTALAAAEQARTAEAEQRQRAEADEQKAHAAAAAEKQAKETAQAREAESKAVLQFVETQVFAAARPENLPGGLGYNVTLRQALEAALPFVGSQFRDQPLIEARLRMTLGTSLWYLGDAKGAAEQFMAVRAIRTQTLGPAHPDTLKSMANLAIAYAALGRHIEALKLREETLARQRATLGPDHPDTLGSMVNLALSYYALGRYPEAVKLLEEALPVMRTKMPNHQFTLNGMGNLADAYAALGRHVEALKLREETLAQRRAEFGPEHADTLQSMHNLAMSYAVLGRHAEALRLHEQTLALRNAKLGPDHPDTLGSMMGLANSYAALGRHAEAVALGEETVTRMKAKLGPDHRDTLGSIVNLAGSYAALGRVADAVKMLEEAQPVLRAKMPDHQFTLNCMVNLAQSYAGLGRHAEALRLRQEALPLLRAKLGPEHPSTIVCAFRVAERAKDVAACRQLDETWEKLNRTDADSLVTAARMRAVTATIAGLDAAGDDAGRAMAWLKKAVAAGYKDAAHMKGDKDLIALQDREDFKKLLTELEASAAKPK